MAPLAAAQSVAPEPHVQLRAMEPSGGGSMHVRSLGARGSMHVLLVAVTVGFPTIEMAAWMDGPSVAPTQ